MGENEVKRGRPRSEKAHRAILESTVELMKEVGIRNATVDEIAARSGVSKATIYKWWPNKTAVAIDAFLSIMEAEVILPDLGNSYRDFVEQLKSVSRFYASPQGRLFAELIAEGQSDPQALEMFRTRFLAGRREAAIAIWKRGVDRGELRGDIDEEIAIDLIYGPMIYRLLTGHAELDDAIAEQMIDAVFKGVTCRD